MENLSAYEAVFLLYSQHRERLFCQGVNFFNGKTEFTEDIEECIQDVFWEAYKRYEILKDHEKIGAWLSTALRYRLQTRLARIRKDASHIHFSLDQSQYEGVTCRVDTDAIAAIDLKDCVFSIMQCLSQGDRELLCDCYLRQQTTEELASRRNTSRATVRAYLSRARKRARSIALDFA